MASRVLDERREALPSRNNHHAHHTNAGRQGRANATAVCALLLLSVGLLAQHGYRRLVFGNDHDGSLLDSEADASRGKAYVKKWLTPHTVVGSCLVLGDVGVVALALRLYAAPLRDAIGMATEAGLEDEMRAYRDALKRHLGLCACAIVAACWTWCALVFALA